MPITLSSVPGFSDLSSAPLAATKPALGVHLARMNQNGNFGMVRLEVFTGVYAHGDTVPVPKSDVDGYTYDRSELIYLWVPMNTANQATGWASYREPWTMWYGLWNVDQNTGEVFSEIGYRGNNDHKDRQASTNDGVVQVFTVAQRQKTGLTMSSVPSYTLRVPADFPVDRALRTGLMTSLNANSKFATVGTEVMYMGEFFNGQTVPQPVSPVDGRTYTYSECMFQTSWRWTADTDANNNPIKPAINKGQLQDWSASVGPSGLVQIANTQVAYELSGRHTYNTGKVAVFAFCQRPLGATFAAVNNAFSEIADSTFWPGSTLRASTMQQLCKNINQAVCTPEFFGPANYSNGNTIPLPVSPLDGYVYSRSELTYVWDWANTGPASNTSSRLSLVHGSISSLGVVTVNDYRLNSGASTVSLANEGSMRVVVVARRQNSVAAPPVIDFGPPDFLVGGGDTVSDTWGNLDTVPDGSTYARPLLTRINAGRPTIDFTENIHVGKIVDNIADGSLFGRTPLSVRAASRPSAAAMGFQVISNPDFQNGTTNYGVYDNNATGNVTHTLVTDTAAPGGFGKKLQITTVAGAAPNPGLGGFFYTLGTDSGSVAVDKYHVGDSYILTVMANIPVGYSINFANNSLGTGGAATWLTSQAGTGNWQPYVLRVNIGASPSSFAFPFFYLTGTAPVTWFVGYMNAIDMDQPQRFGVSSLDPNQRAAIDFSQGAHLNKQLDNIGDGSTFKRLLFVNADNTFHLSSAMNPQASVLPNQAVLVTFQVPDPNTIIGSWLAQSLGRPDSSTLSVVASGGSTMLTDGDGESATVGSQAAGWTLNAGNGLLGANDAVHSGSKALKCTNSIGATSLNQQTVSVVGGQMYCIEGWIKTDAITTVAGHGAYLLLQLGTGVTSFDFVGLTAGNGTQSSTQLQCGVAANGSAHAYTFVQMYFIPNNNGTVVLNTQLTTSNAASAWWDDVKMYTHNSVLTYRSLTASTAYYIYMYILNSSGVLSVTNGNPPATTPNDSLALQTGLDGRISLPVVKITTPSSGSGGSFSGGGSGSCPEYNEVVFLRRYDCDGNLVFEGEEIAGNVRLGFESDDGAFRTGDFLLGFSFAKGRDVWRAVHFFQHVPCGGWSVVDGRKVTACEAIYWDGKWTPAWKTPLASHDSVAGLKVQVQMEADWEDEHNYYVGTKPGSNSKYRRLLIHNFIPAS